MRTENARNGREDRMKTPKYGDERRNGMFATFIVNMLNGVPFQRSPDPGTATQPESFLMGHLLSTLFNPDLSLDEKILRQGFSYTLSTTSQAGPKGMEGETIQILRLRNIVSSWLLAGPSQFEQVFSTRYIPIMDLPQVSPVDEPGILGKLLGTFAMMQSLIVDCNLGHEFDCQNHDSVRTCFCHDCLMSMLEALGRVISFACVSRRDGVSELKEASKSVFEQFEQSLNCVARYPDLLKAFLKPFASEGARRGPLQTQIVQACGIKLAVKMDPWQRFAALDL